MTLKLRALRQSGRADAAWTDAGGAVLIHAAAGPDPQVLEHCARLAARHDPTLVFLDLPPGGTIADRDRFAAHLADRPGIPRFVPVRPGADTGFSAAQFAEWLAYRLGRAVLAYEGRPVNAVGGLFVPAQSGAGWLRLEPGRVPTAHSRRFPEPAWEYPYFSDVLDLGDGVRTEPLPAGTWIMARGAPQIADSFRTWLVSGLPVDARHPRVVIGHPGPVTVPLTAVAAFWEGLDDAARRVVRFADFGPAGTPSRALGQEMADLLGAPVVVGPGVPLLAPSATGGLRIRTLLRDGVMHWQPYVWDLRYLPSDADGEESGPEPVGYRTPIEGLVELAPGVYEYAEQALLEVTQSGLWMRPPGTSPDAAAVRGVLPEADRPKLFYEAGSLVDAARMRRLAEEAVARLEPELREICDVLPSTAAHQSAVTAPEEAPWVPAGVVIEIATEPEPTTEAEPESATEAEPGSVAEAEAEPEPAAEPEPEPAPKANAEPEPAAEPEPVLEVAAEPVTPDPEPLPTPLPTPQPQTPATSPPIGRIRLESGPPLGFPMPAAVAAVALPPASSVAPPEPAPLPLQARPPTPDSPGPEPVRRSPAPAPRAVSGPRVQPVPSPENSAVLPSRSLDQERQWLRRNLGEQYDATVGSVARVLSEFPGLRTGGSPTADVLIDLVAVQLYLSGGTRRFDDLVRSGAAGPHVPLARCIVSGLRRLPSHRGASLMRTTLREPELQWYGGRKLVTEWAFAPAMTGGRVRLPGDVDVLIWSMTARRTHLLAPRLPDQVVFLPGTSFKVLSVLTADRARVLLRELSASEVGADGRVDPGSVPLDEFALAGLTEAGEKWLAQEAPEELPESCADRFTGSPGLIVRPVRISAASTPRDAREEHPTVTAGAQAAPSHLEGRAS